MHPHASFTVEFISNYQLSSRKRCHLSSVVKAWSTTKATVPIIGSNFFFSKVAKATFKTHYMLVCQNLILLMSASHSCSFVSLNFYNKLNETYTNLQLIPLLRLATFHCFNINMTPSSSVALLPSG